VLSDDNTHLAFIVRRRIMVWMSSSEAQITHVSDTALMVAACRAAETELDDAFSRDPFAARLAGERGPAILNALPHAAVLRIGMAIRTRFLDDLLLEALNTGEIATVMNLGCGLDTRPWRLDLPPGLRWIEVDFPEMLDYKDQVLKGELPRCRRERVSLDLNDRAQRKQLYESCGAQPALMITEGLLLYLPGPTVDALAAETFQEGAVRYWISDITTSVFSRVLGGGADTTAAIRHVRAPDCLEGEAILETIERNGWHTAAQRSYITDVGFVQERVLRMTGGKTPPPLPFPSGDPTGVHRFERSQHS
jgi:methyltransferase (TIGR00027 family)